MKSFPSCLVLTLSLAVPVCAGPIVKDHVSDSSNWSGMPLILQHYPPSIPDAAAGATATFIGNGETLSTVGALFGHDSVDGIPNQGNPAHLDFRIAFFDSQADYVADPFLESPTSQNTFHRFDTVSNSDWMIPLGQSDDGHDLFYWEFDLSFLDIQTTPGATHFISITPETDSASGVTFVASSNAQMAIGTSEDWFISRVAGIGPDTLSNLGAPFPNAAYRITTAVPEPDFAWPSLMAILICIGIPIRIHPSRNHNSRGLR